MAEGCFAVLASSRLSGKNFLPQRRSKVFTKAHKGIAIFLLAISPARQLAS